jgi:predicted nucleic acid-binding protein
MDVATDTCILVNFLCIGRLDLLGSLHPYRFFIPPEVKGEIEDPDQLDAIEEAIHRGWLHETRLEGPTELEIYANATERLGSGESACIALVQSRNWVLATDDSKGVKWSRVISAGFQVLNTPGVILLGIRRGLLTIEEADELKATLEQHRFRITFASFREVL